VLGHSEDAFGLNATTDGTADLASEHRILA
jgi:hypothetical protein